MLPINRHPAARQLERFARLWLPLFVAMVGAAAWWRLDSPLAAGAAWVVGGVAVAASLASREVARNVFVGLQTITYPIGFVVSTLALAFLFFVVFTPIGWVMRAVGRDPLRLRARDATSHWIPYEQRDDPEQAFRQY